MKRVITALAVIFITVLVWFLIIPEKVEINESSEINYAMILDTEFGEVISGQDVADAISLVEKDRNDKPLEDIILKKVSISK